MFSKFSKITSHSSVHNSVFYPQLSLQSSAFNFSLHATRMSHLVSSAPTTTVHFSRIGGKNVMKLFHRTFCFIEPFCLCLFDLVRYKMSPLCMQCFLCCLLFIYACFTSLYTCSTILVLSTTFYIHYI